MKSTAMQAVKSFNRLGHRTFASAAFSATLRGELDAIEAAGTYKRERVIISDQSSEISVMESDEPVLNFCANNYLGLANDPEIVRVAQETIRTHGFGLASVRFICGTQDIHKKLERTIADFHGMDDCILYPSCFDANAGLFEAILTKEDAVISDALNHASIIDGIRLCKAARYRYANGDMADLEAKLQEAQGARHRLIATDGAFSMDGTVAKLKEICDLADKYDAKVFIDECHATGFMGKTGRGTDEHCGVQGRVDIINSTLGKALGGATGGYTAASQEIVDLLRQRARPYLFSNTLAPSVAGASLKVFEMLNENSSFVEKLKGNTHKFRTMMGDAGFTVKGDFDHPICPVMIGDAALATKMADALLKKNIYVIGFSYPVVPKGQARIRVQMSAAHSLEQVEMCANAFIEVGKEMGVIASA